MIVLTVNTGSSSARLALVTADRTGTAHVQRAQRYETDGREAGALLTAFLGSGECAPTKLVVHRVVHGGESLLRPCRIDAAVEQEIERLAELALLHNPVSLAWIRAARDFFGAACAAGA